MGYNFLLIPLWFRLIFCSDLSSSTLSGLSTPMQVFDSEYYLQCSEQLWMPDKDGHWISQKHRRYFYRCFVKMVPTALYSLHFWKSTNGTGTWYGYSGLWPTQCVGGFYLTVVDSLAPLPINNNIRDFSKKELYLFWKPNFWWFYAMNNDWVAYWGSAWTRSTLAFVREL